MTSAGMGVARDSLPIKGPPSTVGASSGSHSQVGVAEVLSRWRVQIRQQPPPQRHPPVPNFVTLNQKAVKSGHVTVKQVKEYRAQASVAKASPASKAHRGRAPQRTQIPDITFGVKSRAPTPFYDVLSHEYARRWIEDQMKRRSEHERRHVAKCVSFAHTRTSLLRTQNAHPHINAHTHTCGRYAQVGPALDTFRKRRTNPPVNKSVG
ncbi:cilia- and flagella-associated protein 77-like isoform X1 [Hippocampus zosterae]|uniref:cilia- and flagella-associated protein 77-like isoform X1 n=2 Tax=Hippocampus zosterae TaxID=109293 RepID=UPI00223D9E07|nr:cilia- and flagella-associated protein 77-like isoform X1 [Hippocampus zosterae]XP_051923896.1 cilia- and flagella-associated protein 77-like isoform X1 [Hippocampus zosterae]